MSYLNKGLMVGAALAAMSLSACATKDFVAKSVEPVNALAQANADSLKDTQGQVSSLQGDVNSKFASTGARLDANDARLAGLDQATKDAMMRADARRCAS